MGEMTRTMTDFGGASAFKFAAQSVVYIRANTSVAWAAFTIHNAYLCKQPYSISYAECLFSRIAASSQNAIGRWANISTFQHVNALPPATLNNTYIINSITRLIISPAITAVKRLKLSVKMTKQR
jgi:hypothetical protein